MASNTIIGGGDLTANPVQREIEMRLAQQQANANWQAPMARQQMQNALARDEMAQQKRQVDLAMALQQKKQEQDFGLQQQAMDYKTSQPQPFNLEQALYGQVKAGRATPETYQGLGMYVAPEPKTSTSTSTSSTSSDVVTEQEKNLSALSPEKQFDRAMKLQSAFNTQSKDFFKVRDAKGRIDASALDPSPAGDLALIFNYMKVLDPGSTVREGEFATAEQAGSLPQTLVNQYNKVLSGERLGETRADFVKRAGLLFEQAEKGQQRNIDRFSQQAERWGMNPSDVILDLASNPQQGQGVVEPEIGIDLNAIYAKYGLE